MEQAMKSVLSKTMVLPIAVRSAQAIEAKKLMLSDGWFRHFLIENFFFGFYVQHFGQIEYYYCCYQRQSPYNIEFSSTFFLKTSNISIIFVWLNWEFVYLLKTCWNCVVSSPMWPPDPDIKYDFKKVAIFWISRYTHGTRWWPLTFCGIFWCFFMPITQKYERESSWVQLYLTIFW